MIVAIIWFGGNKIIKNTFQVVIAASTLAGAHLFIQRMPRGYQTVLENGVIIERGNHTSPLKQKGRYFELYTGQFD